MTELTLEQINYIIQTQFLSYREQVGENYHEVSFRNWYNSKKQNYSGKALQEKLEGNAIYFIEATHSSKSYLISYLIEGEPNLSAEAVPDFVKYVGTILPNGEISPPLKAFLMGYIQDKPAQVSNVDYFRLRYLRESGDRRDYLKEIYESCKIYRAATGFMDFLLASALMDANLAGCAKKLNRYSVDELVQRQLILHASLSMGMMQVLGPDGKPFKFGDKSKPSSQKKKRWKLW